MPVPRQTHGKIPSHPRLLWAEPVFESDVHRAGGTALLLQRMDHSKAVHTDICLRAPIRRISQPQSKRSAPATFILNITWRFADQPHANHKIVVNTFVQFNTETNSAIISELMRIVIDLHSIKFHKITTNGYN